MTARASSGSHSVLHLIPQFAYFGDRKIVGGYSSAVLTLSSTQIQMGMHVEIAGRIAGGTPCKTASGARIHSLGAVDGAGHLIATCVFVLHSVRLLATSRRRFDIVHIHSGHLEYLVLAVAARALAPRAGVIHTIYCPPSRTKLRRCIQKVLTIVKPRRCVLTAMSKNISLEISKLSRLVPAPKILHPAIDVDYWSHNNDSVRDARGNSDILRILFVGNASADKNLRGLIVALGIVKRAGVQFELVVTTELARTAPTEDVRNLVELAEAEGITSDLTTVGIVDNMRDLIQDCDIHVAPFLSTDGPSDYFITTLEAMAAGRAVIASALAGMSEVITNGVDGYLVNQRNPADIAEAILGLQSPAVREAVGSKASTRARQMFSPEDVFRHCEEIYDKAI